MPYFKYGSYNEKRTDKDVELVISSDCTPGYFSISLFEDDKEIEINLDADDAFELAFALLFISKTLRNQEESLADQLLKERKEHSKKYDQLNAKYINLYNKYSGLLSVLNNVAEQVKEK